MRATLTILAIVAVLSGCVPAAATTQTPAPAARPLSNAVQILPASRLAAIADSLPPGAIRTVQIARFAGLTNAVNLRDSSGVHERHVDFTDIFVVQRGGARLLYGGTAEGEREAAPGEWRGGTIRNGAQSELRPGDVVVVPAGVPHQMLLEPGQRLVYLSFKVARHR